MRYNNIVFDLDGTLFDTSEGIIKSVERLIEIKGLKKLSQREKLSMIGPSIQDSLKRLYNLSDEEIIECSNDFREIYLNNFLLCAKLYENMIDLIKKLHDNNCKLAVATYKRQDCTDKLIEHFELKKYFNCVYGSDYNGIRTKQDIIELCIKDLNVKSRSSIVMIGDSEFDAIGAKKANIDFIGVTYGFGFKNKEQIKAYQNASSVDTINELNKYLLSV